MSHVRTRFLWKLVVILAAANAMLAGLSLWQSGTVPGIYGGAAAVEPGATVRAVDGLNLRDAPGLDAGVIGVVEGGATMEVTGPARRVDGQVWWPVAYDLDGFTVRAFAAESYLSAMRPTGRDRVVDWLESLSPG